MRNPMGLLCCSPTGSSGSHTRRRRGTTVRAARRASRRRRRRSRSSIRRRTRPPYSRAGTSTCQRQSVSAVACAPTTLCDFSGYPRRTGCYTPLQWRSSGVGGRNAMQSGTGGALRRPLGRRAVGGQRLPSHPPHERRNGALDCCAIDRWHRRLSVCRRSNDACPSCCRLQRAVAAQHDTMTINMPT